VPISHNSSLGIWELKEPIHVRVWLASPAGLGFQWVKLVRVWSVTSRAWAYYIYIRSWFSSQAPRGGLASQTRTCMTTFRVHAPYSVLYNSTTAVTFQSLYRPKQYQGIRVLLYKSALRWSTVSLFLFTYIEQKVTGQCHSAKLISTHVSDPVDI
jgi:hypothetical protein